MVERLTEKQAAALRGELAELEGPRREEVVAAIKKAREFGDLSENFEYHAAKNEQGLLERRITILRDRLQRAVLVDEEAAAASSIVAVGSRVSIEPDDGEVNTIDHARCAMAMIHGGFWGVFLTSRPGRARVTGENT